MLSSAAVERIVHRVCLAFGGKALRAGPMRWALTIPESIEDPDDLGLAFHVELQHTRGRHEISCDAALNDYTKDQAFLVAQVTRAFADGLAREQKTFSTFADVAAFLKEDHDVEDRSANGFVFVHDDADFPLTLNEVVVAREPWITIETPFVEEVEDSWLLERNGLMTHLHFVSDEDGASLRASFPLALLTGQRLTELMEDVVLFCRNTERQLDGDDEGSRRRAPAVASAKAHVLSPSAHQGMTHP